MRNLLELRKLSETVKQWGKEDPAEDFNILITSKELDWLLDIADAAHEFNRVWRADFLPVAQARHDLADALMEPKN